MFKYFRRFITSKLPENNRFELIWKLAQVDFRKRYYNDRLGLFWALLNPLIRVLVYFSVFTYVLDRTRLGVDNFALYLFSGLIFWMAFVETSRKGLKLLIAKRYLIQNIKFNKIDLYISSALASLMGFSFNLLAYGVAAFIILPLCGFSMPSVGWSVLFLPILIVNIYLIALGFSMFLSVAHIYYKDVQHLLDVTFLIGIWSSGVIIPVSKFIVDYPLIPHIQPIAGILTNVRNVILLGNPINEVYLISNLVFGIIFYLIGVQLVNKKTHLAFEKI